MNAILLVLGLSPLAALMVLGMWAFKDTDTNPCDAVGGAFGALGDLLGGLLDIFSGLGG